MVQVNEERARLDREGRWSYFLPELAADDATLSRIEAQLGEAVDPHYRQFLQMCGGWRGFYQRVDLFGPMDLIDGPLFSRGQQLLAELDDVALDSLAVSRSELMPIACSINDVDLFAVIRAGRPTSGTVHWLAGAPIDSYTSFDEFFVSMIA
jgi:hypothetical protein